MRQDLIWTIVPNAGILEPGDAATVCITGTLNATISGPTSAQFKAESLQSGKFDLAMVNTTFYYCEEVIAYRTASRSKIQSLLVKIFICFGFWRVRCFFKFCLSRSERVCSEKPLCALKICD